jgi:hypothetical protein
VGKLGYWVAVSGIKRTLPEVVVGSTFGKVDGIVVSYEFLQLFG